MQMDRLIFFQVLWAFDFNIHTVVTALQQMKLISKHYLGYYT